MIVIFLDMGYHIIGMTGRQLQQARKQANRTQADAARDLGVTQAYLSMLEKGKRSVSNDLKRKMAHLFGFSPTQLPVNEKLLAARSVSDDELAAELAGLGYEGFSHLKTARAKNPAEVLAAALKADDRDARLVEALPWVMLAFPDLDWKALVNAAKLNNLQNRLGYLTNVARRLAEKHRNSRVAAKLGRVESELENSLLFREETLCNESMTNAERKWLETNRSAEARHWRLLTYLSPEHLRYGSE